MRITRIALLLVAVVPLAGLLALNWQAHLRTQQKIDALAATLAGRPANETPAPKPQTPPPPAPGEVPRELSRGKLPPYVIETPDVLLIEAVVKDPKSGKVDCLPAQPLSGSFIVRPDGTVSLGYWGSVNVTGLTLDQAATAIRKQLAKYQSPALAADDLTVTVDVYAYNSKFYYVITDLHGNDGEQVYRMPLTGNETVLDAVAGVGGLPEVASKSSIRVVRKLGVGEATQSLPVDWAAITQHGVTKTNYQLHVGDRVYVARSPH